MSRNVLHWNVTQWSSNSQTEGRAPTFDLSFAVRCGRQVGQVCLSVETLRNFRQTLKAGFAFQSATYTQCYLKPKGATASGWFWKRLLDHSAPVTILICASHCLKPAHLQHDGNTLCVEMLFVLILLFLSSEWSIDSLIHLHLLI